MYILLSFSENAAEQQYKCIRNFKKFCHLPIKIASSEKSHCKFLKILYRFSKPKSGTPVVWLVLIIWENIKPAIQWKSITWSAINFKKTHKLYEFQPEPAICSCGTDQRIPWFDSCQLTIKWTSNIKLHRCMQCISWPVWAPCCAMLSSYVRAREPFTADEDDHTKMNA